MVVHTTLHHLTSCRYPSNSLFFHHACSALMNPGVADAKETAPQKSGAKSSAGAKSFFSRSKK